MSTGSAELRQHPARARRLVPVLLIALSPLAACSDDAAPTAAPQVSAVDAERAIGRVLRQRADAVLAGDRAGFLATLDDGDPAHVAAQSTYFDNVDDLPIAVLDHRLDPDSLEPAGDGGLWGEVEVALQLEEYDAAPVVSRDRYLFEPGPGGRRYRIADVTVARPQPWDLGPVEVRQDDGVLGVFDELTVDGASAVLDTVSEARSAVARVVPVTDPAPVLLLATSDLPLPEALDAVTEPVPVDGAAPGGDVASYRFLLSSDVLTQPDDVLDRLARHELTHVLLGDRGRGAPLWLTEGIAEYVSVHPVPPVDRRLPASALSLVAGGVDELPPDEVFTGDQAQAWYAVAWWICEYVAREHGESTLWWLLDELAGDADEAEVLDRVLGLSPEELAHGGADLMAESYSS